MDTSYQTVSVVANHGRRVCSVAWAPCAFYLRACMTNILHTIPFPVLHQCISMFLDLFLAVESIKIGFEIFRPSFVGQILKKLFFGPKIGHFWQFFEASDLKSVQNV